MWLRANPFCVCTECAGRYVPANVVDHRTPHRGDAALFWDTGNWQSMRKQCHDRKTAMEDGGFGRAPAAVPAPPDQRTEDRTA